jgi:TPR repeat protein
VQLANQWLHTAAQKGKHPEAQHELGRAYEQGTWGCEVDARKALKWFEQAAHGGWGHAMLEAAERHL